MTAVGLMYTVGSPCEGQWRFGLRGGAIFVPSFCPNSSTFLWLLSVCFFAWTIRTRWRALCSPGKVKSSAFRGNGAA
jgi:hypothetical protein